MKWLPIDTAPRNGDPIWTYDGHELNKFQLAWWGEWEEVEWEDVDDNTRSRVVTKHAGWLTDEHNTDDFCWMPTHWHPVLLSAPE